MKRSWNRSPVRRRLQHVERRRARAVDHALAAPPRDLAGDGAYGVVWRGDEDDVRGVGHLLSRIQGRAARHAAGQVPGRREAAARRSHDPVPLPREGQGQGAAYESRAHEPNGRTLIQRHSAKAP